MKTSQSKRCTNGLKFVHNAGGVAGTMAAWEDVVKQVKWISYSIMIYFCSNTYNMLV